MIFSVVQPICNEGPLEIMLRNEKQSCLLVIPLELLKPDQWIGSFSSPPMPPSRLITQLTD